MRARLGMLPVAVDAVHEIRKARHRRRKAAFRMEGHRELAWRDELMHVPAHAIELPAVSPELRRPSRHDRAAQAVGALADPPSVFPQHVRRTNQPVLVRGVELERRRTGRRQCERMRPEQRDVVEVDHVVPALRQQRLQRRRLEQRPACLLRQQRRQPPEPAAQPVHVDVRMTSPPSRGAPPGAAGGSCPGSAPRPRDARRLPMHEPAGGGRPRHRRSSTAGRTWTSEGY